MSKKKQKKFKDPSNRMERLIFQATFTASKTGVISGKLDEIIDLLHVLVENTKKPEPLAVRVPGRPIPAEQVLKYGYDFQSSEEDLARRRAEYQSLWNRKPEDGLTPVKKAAEEVEDYHGIATTEPYSLPVRIHR